MRQPRPELECFAAKKTFCSRMDISISFMQMQVQSYKECVCYILKMTCMVTIFDLCKVYFMNIYNVRICCIV